MQLHEGGASGCQGVRVSVYDTVIYHATSRQAASSWTLEIPNKHFYPFLYAFAVGLFVGHGSGCCGTLHFEGLGTTRMC